MVRFTQNICRITVILTLFACEGNAQEVHKIMLGSENIIVSKVIEIPLSREAGKFGIRLLAGHNAGYISAYGQKNGVQVWDTSSGKSKFCIGENGKTYNQIALSTGGKYLAAYREKQIYIWETASCRLLKSLEVRKDLNNYGLAISSNGKYLFYSHDDSNFLFKREKVILWDIENGLEKADMKAQRLPISGNGNDPLFDRDALNLSSADFSPDSKIIAVQYSYRIYLWDVETGKVIRRLVDKSLDFESSQVWIYAVKFSRDGTLLLSNAADGTVKVWDVQTGELKQTLRIGDRVHGQTSFSKDNKYIATGNSRGEISIWEISTGKMLWKGAKKNYGPAFSEPEAGLVSVENGDIYDLLTGKKVEDIKGEFLDNGKLLMRDSNGNISTWIVERK